jgi:tetratricopeptide (TPR) repeat protein
MITLDDLHAADEPSLLLLRFLARELGSMRVLILGAFRDVDPVAGQPLAETIREVSREPVTGRLMLTGLSEQQVGQYVDVAASGLAPSSSLKATLYSQTEGNPLFVGETVRLLAIEGAAELEANAVLAIPQSVRGVIARRLEHLSPACRHLLELAAVIGREFAIDALSPAAAGVEDSPLESLDEAIAARVVSEAPSDRGRLRFAHVLIRDTLYEGLGAVRRMRLHRHVGQTLEALYGDRPGPHLAELAHHYSQAEPAHTDKAIGYATGAGDRAARLLAFEEAARLYRLALGLGGSAMAGDKRCDLLLTLGDVEARAGNMDGAKQTFAEAAELARELGLGGRLARAALGYGGRFSFARAGTDERLMPLLEEGLAALGSTDAAMRARLLARLAGARRGETSREPRDSLAREALNLARGTGDRPTLGFVLEAVYMTLFDSATPEQRLAISAEMLSIAEQASDKERAVLARMYRFVVFIRIGELAAAQRELGRMNFVATQLGQPAQRAFALVGRAMLALLTGSLAEAESLIHQVLRLGEHAEAWAVAYHRLQLWALRREQGRLAEVEQTVQRSISEHPNYPIWRCVLTHLHVAIGNVDEARDELETLAAGDKFAGLPDDEEWNLGVSLLSEVAVALGDLPRVQILYELLSPYSDLLIYGAPEVSTGATSRYLGKLAVGLGRWEDAERHFSHALELNAKVRARPWLARTQLDYARMLRVRGIPSDQARADELLRSAVSTFRSLGMTSHADSASTSEPSASELVL